MPQQGGARIEIRGIQEVQAKNNKMIAALKPSSALGRAVKFATIAAHRGAVRRTHVDTGALRSALRMDVRDARGRVSIDEGAYNPRGGASTKPSQYGFFEFMRGGSHNAFERTVSEDGAHIAADAIKLIEGAL